jgi:hypothetical protein
MNPLKVTNDQANDLFRAMSGVGTPAKISVGEAIDTDVSKEAMKIFNNKQPGVGAPEEGWNVRVYDHTFAGHKTSPPTAHIFDENGREVWSGRAP